MRTLSLIFAAAAGLSAGAVAAGAPLRFTSPLQPFASPDGRVHLLRPATASVSTADTAVGALMSPGWRLAWDGAPASPGRMVVRLSLAVVPPPPQTRASEYLQVGVSRDRAAVRACLTAGLKGPSGGRRPDRVIAGRRFAVWTNGDAGMSQQISATDLRAVADGACYAVERFGYGDTASARDATVTLTQARGAAMLDQALASLQLGRVPAGAVKQPPTLKAPPHTVAY